MSWLFGHLNGVILQTFTKLLYERTTSARRALVEPGRRASFVVEMGYKGNQKAPNCFGVLSFALYFTRTDSFSRQVSLRVAVDDADDDNDAHARDRRDRQRQPAVLEAPRDDVTQKDRSRVLVVRRAVTPWHVATT